MTWIEILTIANFVLFVLIIAYLIKFRYDYNLHMRVIQSFCFDYADFKENLGAPKDTVVKGRTVSVFPKSFHDRGAR